MPIHKVEGPDKHIYEIEAPEGATEEQILRYAQKMHVQRQEQIQPASSMWEAGKGGAKRMVSTMGTSVTAPLMGAADAGLAGLARKNEIKERPAFSEEKIASIYNTQGLLPAAWETATQVPKVIAEQVPNLASMWAGAKAGSLAGASLPLPPQGRALAGVVGGIGGALIPSYLTHTGGNVERQVQEDQLTGRPIEVDTSKAYGAPAVGQSLLDVGSAAFVFGKLLGIAPKAMGTEAAEKLAKESLPRVLATGAAKVAGVEVPAEVLQQMLERYQAGLPLTDEGAFKEYRSTVYQTAMMGPIGSASRIGERSQAKNDVAAAQQRQAEEEAQQDTARQTNDDYRTNREEAENEQMAVDLTGREAVQAEVARQQGEAQQPAPTPSVAAQQPAPGAVAAQPTPTETPDLAQGPLPSEATPAALGQPTLTQPVPGRKGKIVPPVAPIEPVHPETIQGVPASNTIQQNVNINAPTELTKERLVAAGFKTGKTFNELLGSDLQDPAVYGRIADMANDPRSINAVKAATLLNNVPQPEAPNAPFTGITSADELRTGTGMAQPVQPTAPQDAQAAAAKQKPVGVSGGPPVGSPAGVVGGTGAQQSPLVMAKELRDHLEGVSSPRAQSVYNELNDHISDYEYILKAGSKDEAAQKKQEVTQLLNDISNEAGLDDLLQLTKKSKAVEPAQARPSSIEAVRGELGNMFLPQQLKAKPPVVVDTYAQLPDSVRGQAETNKAKAFVDPKTQQEYYVASQIPKGEERGTIMHEKGGHLGLPKLIGADRIKALAARVNVWAKETGTAVENKIATEATQRAAESGETTGSDRYNQEVIAYFTEIAVNKYGIDPLKTQPKQYQKVAGWLKELWNGIYNTLRKLRYDPSKLTPADIVYMVYGAARVEMLGKSAPVAGGIQTSPKPEAPLSSMAAIETPKQTLEDRIYGNKSMPPVVKDAVYKTVVNLNNWVKKAGYAAAFGHDLADLVSKVLPSAKSYFELADVKESVQFKHTAEIDRIATQMYSVPDKAKLNAFLKASTRSGVWGFQPDWIPTAEVSKAMEAQFDALSSEAQKSAIDIFRHGHTAPAELQTLITAEINAGFDDLLKTANKNERAQIERKRMRDLKLFTASLPTRSGPYSPIAQFGNYITVAKSQEWVDAEKNKDHKWLDAHRSDGAHYIVEFYDTLGEAKLRAREMQSMGWRHSTAAEKEVYAKGVTEAPWEAMRRLKSMVDREMDGPDASRAQKHINQLLSDLYLSTLAETAARKHDLKRKNVEGTSEDMLRAFVSKGLADANFIAALHSNGKITDALEQMRDDASKFDEHRADRKRALNEILARHALGMHYKPTPIQDKLMSMNGVWTIFTKPSYYFQNLTQPWMMSLPVMARNAGYTKAAKALLDTYHQITPAFGKGGVINGLLNGRFDFDALNIKPDEKAMLKEISELGILDVGISRDLGYWESRGGLTQPIADAMHKLNSWVRQVETVNRVTTALASYRLAGGGPAGVTEAKHIIRTTHGNYSAANAPRLWSMVPAGKIVLQFRKFQFIQASLILRLAGATHYGNPTEKAAAKKALMWTMGHYGVMTGVQGLPAMGLIGYMMASMFGDEDEPADFEKFFTDKAMGGDKDMANIFLKGAPSLIGLDLTGMLGAQNMLSILPFTDIDLTDRTGYAKTMMGLAGSFWGGTVPNALEGVTMMSKGDLYKGMEKMLPSGFAKAAQSYRMATEGYTNRDNDLLMDGEELAGLVAVAQGMGFRTMKVADIQKATGVTIQFEKYYKARAGEITHRYNEAFKEQDFDTMQELRQEFIDLQASKVRNGFKAQPLSNLIKAPMEQRKRESSVIGGVRTNTGNRGFVRSLVGEEQ